MSEDLHSLSGAYALDALSDHERTDFEKHLARCAICREEVSSLREVAPLLAETVAVAPPAGLRTMVLERAATTRQDPPPVVHELASVHPLRRRIQRQWTSLAAAAALVVGGVATWQVVEQVTMTTSEEVASASDARTWEAKTTDGATVRIIRSESMDRAVLDVDGLPDPGAGHAYQAWLQDPEGSMVSAGMVPGTDGELLLEGDIDQATGVGLSIEPSIGSSEPTTDPVALVELS